MKRIKGKLEDTLKRIETAKSSPLTKKVAKWVLFSLLIFTVVGFFVLPPIVKSVLLRKLSENLHRNVSIQKVTINPYMLSMKIKGFEVKERNGTKPFLSFDELYVNAQLVSLIKGGIVLKEIRFQKPYVNIERNEETLYNFSDLLKEHAEGPKTETKPLKYSMNNIQVMGGSIDFWDGPKRTRHTVRELNAAIPFISNLPYYVDFYVNPFFEANVNGRLISLQGLTKPFKDSLETSVEIRVNDLDIPHYLAYVPAEMNFKMLSGRLDANTLLFFTQYKDRAPSIALTGSLQFRDIRIVDKKESPLIHLPLLDISVDSGELMSRRILLSKVLLQSPEIHVVRDKTGRVNLQSLLPEKGYVLKRKEESPVLAVYADEIGLTNGTVVFSDLLQEEAFRSTLEKIQVKIDHFGNARDWKSAITVSLGTEAEEGLKVSGEFTVEPLSSQGRAELTRIPLKKYSPYYRTQILFDVMDGILDLSAEYAFQQEEKEQAVRLSDLSAHLTSLSLKKRDEKDEFLRIPEIAVKEASVDLQKREVVVGEFSTEKGFVMVKRGEEGKWNVQTLLPPASDAGKTAATQKQSERPWTVTTKKISVQGYSVKGEDIVPTQPVSFTAEMIKLSGEDISTEKNKSGKVSLSLKLGKKGSVSAGGSVVLNPVSANVRVNCTKVDIVPFQAYLGDRVKIVLAEGDFSTSGALTLGYGEGGSPKVAYKGELFLTKFWSLDKSNAEDFLKWDSLHFGNLRAGYNPFSLNIDEVAVADFYSRIIISEDGTLNVQDIAGSEEANETAAGENTTATKMPPPEKKKAPDKAVTIEKVTLQGGAIDFLDRHVKPNVSAKLAEVGGRISGLSSEENKFADVDLKAKYDNYAPLEITGKINPLREDLYVELKADFKDMDLSPMSPYGGKYMGYTIEKGKLTLNVQYLVVKRKLTAQNNLFMDQFTLGDRVESPDATKLPVKLAIALLKNRKGEISLDLPVTGNLDDPKFSLGGIIIKILLNILVKAATSPFALLGAIFGGGEELSYIEFDYGSASLNEQGLKKLDTLVKALYDRPALKLDIGGYADPEKDREALREHLFKGKIKAQKLKEIVKKGETPVPLEEVSVSAEEYPKYLKLAYKEEKFPKPRNIIGIAKDLPVPEMEKLMRTYAQVNDDALRLLASERALKVKDHILKSGKVEQERIFLVESKALQAEKKEKIKESRVDFKLK